MQLELAISLEEDLFICFQEALFKSDHIIVGVEEAHFEFCFNLRVINIDTVMLKIVKHLWVFADLSGVLAQDLGKFFILEVLEFGFVASCLVQLCLF